MENYFPYFYLHFANKDNKTRRKGFFLFYSVDIVSVVNKLLM